MANHRLPWKISTPLSHLPTWFFIIGYPLFWIQLYTHSANYGVTSWWGWVIWAMVALVSKDQIAPTPFNAFKKSVQFIRKGPNEEKYFWLAGLGLSLVIIGIVIIASLKPVHLVQESDCLKYHYTLPRQHLILGSFAHIPWAADDLFLLPMDFALAPFWFVTPLLNKIPQLIILFGLIGVMVRLTSALATERRPWAGPLIVLLILGAHGFGIQMGTGMLDLAVAYLFLASLDSLRLGNWFLAGVEFAFFFWSKPLMPMGVMLIMAVWATFFVLALRNRWQFNDMFVLKDWQRALGLFLVLSIVVAGPFIVKSIYYAGTPFYPLAPGMFGGVARIQIHPQAWKDLQETSRFWMVFDKNNYGHGQDLFSFAKHWWLLGVPEKGVNNAFDYPLGLTYLLLIGPFLFLLVKDTVRRKFFPLSVLVVIIWVLWWFTSQQSRFLYIPLLIIFMVTIARFDKLSRGLLLCVLISLCFEALSIWGAHKADMNRWGVDTLSSRDKQLLELNHRYHKQSLSGYMDWPTHDVAYAQFPVMVHKENLPHTIKF